MKSNKYSKVRRMIEKECRRNSLVELCEYWGVTCDDFEDYLDAADKGTCEAEEI